MGGHLCSAASRSNSQRTGHSARGAHPAARLTQRNDHATIRAGVTMVSNRLEPPLKGFQSKSFPLKAFLPVHKRFIKNPYLVHQESTPGALKLASPWGRMVVGVNIPHSTGGFDEKFPNRSNYFDSSSLSDFRRKSFVFNNGTFEGQKLCPLKSNT